MRRVVRVLSGPVHRVPGCEDRAMSTGTNPPEPPRAPESPERPLTPGEALMTLFLDNADRGANHANDELIAALRQRARQIEALADLPRCGPTPGRMTC